MNQARHDVFIDPDPSWATTIQRAKERGHRVSAICSPRFKAAYPVEAALIEDLIIADTSDEAAVRRSLRRLGSAHRIDAVLVHRDAIIKKIASACRAAAVPFTDVNSLEIALSKVRTRQVLQLHGLSGVKFCAARCIDQIQQAAKRVGFPCVLKPAAGHGSKLTFKLCNPKQLRRAVARVRAWRETAPRRDRWLLAQGFICEEWIEGPIISVEVSVVNGVARAFAVALGTDSAENPCAGYGNVIPLRGHTEVVNRCITYAQRVCSAIGFDRCICDLEMIWTRTGPVLLESNPRKMGGAMPEAYDLATGERFDDIILDTYAGRSPKLKRSRSGLTTVIRKIMPRYAGTVRGRLVSDWLSSFRPRRANVRLCNDALVPGRRVRRLEVLGRLLVVCRDYTYGFACANQAINELAEETGLLLVAGTLPKIRRLQSVAASR